MFDRYMASATAKVPKRKTFLLVGSVILHAILIVGLVIWGFFYVEEVPPPPVTVTFFAAPPPPPPPPPPAGSGHKPKVEKKIIEKPKIKIHELLQPDLKKKPEKQEKKE